MYEQQDSFASNADEIHVGSQRYRESKLPDEYAAAIGALHSRNFSRAAALVAQLWNRDPQPFMLAINPAGQEVADRNYAGLKILGESRKASDEYTITPALAKKMLRYNHQNRAVSRSQLEATFKAMATGNWKSNGIPIILAKCGRLSDGQHRLISCFLLGISFVSQIGYGSDFEDRDTIDIGKRRQPGDRMTMKGIADGRSVANIGRLAFEVTHKRKPGDQEGDEYFERNKERLLLAKEIGATAVCKPKLAGWNHAAFCAAAFFLLDGGAPEGNVREFMQRFSTGENLTRGQSILTLRNHLSSRNDLSRVQLVRTIVAHYNKHRMDKQQKTLLKPDVLEAVELR